MIPRRTGILGGSFDPIHWGHLRLALEAAKAARLDRVLLVVSKDPPHKQPDTPAAQRPPPGISPPRAGPSGSKGLPGRTPSAGSPRQPGGPSGRAGGSSFDPGCGRAKGAFPAPT